MLAVKLIIEKTLC